MKDEISAAVLFLIRLIGNNKNPVLNGEQLTGFESILSGLLVERFKNHWFPEQPNKGQGYRCIRVNETDRKDPVLERAARECGLKYDDLNLPVELTIWVDPAEVACRFGEHRGSYCTVASFKDGNKEFYANDTNSDKVQPTSPTKEKQDSSEMLSNRKRTKSCNATLMNVNKNQHNLQNYQQQQMKAGPIITHVPNYSCSPPNYFYYPAQHLQHHRSNQVVSPVPNPFLKTKPNRHLMPVHPNPGHHVHNHNQQRHNRPQLINVSPTRITPFGSPPRMSMSMSMSMSPNTGNNFMRNDRYHWVNKALVKA